MDAHWSPKWIVPWGHNKAGSVEDIMSSLSIHQIIVAGGRVFVIERIALCDVNDQSVA